MVGGANELEGLVEICYNKMWGSICGSFWNANSANVVCNQLGYHGQFKEMARNLVKVPWTIVHGGQKLESAQKILAGRG